MNNNIYKITKYFKNPINKDSLMVSKKYQVDNYLNNILDLSEPYLFKVFSDNEIAEFYSKIEYIKNINNVKAIIKEFIRQYIDFTKIIYQRTYIHSNIPFTNFIKNNDNSVKLVWGDAYNALKAMNNESIHLMVTSPPYYNARDYSNWNNIDDYLKDMRHIIEEAYRVLDNHRVFVFNVGDVFDNDNRVTKSVWGKRRLPLGAYFINLFEEVGFTFVDDYIWDKGQVQSERHKHENTPYPFYQYPMNCYEHILIFHKHRLDNLRYPCPVCGTLKVNGNTQSEIGLQSWECKNERCFTRSKSNRGKRFSLKSIMTQSNHLVENEIDLLTIRKWRRDITKFNPVFKINSKGENKLGHDAPFPEDIPELAIKLFSYPGDVVLDPFAGSFTSSIVAHKLGRIGVGIEYNKNRFRKSIYRNIKNKLGKNINISEIDI